VHVHQLANVVLEWLHASGFARLRACVLVWLCVGMCVVVGRGTPWCVWGIARVCVRAQHVLFCELQKVRVCKHGRPRRCVGTVDRTEEVSPEEDVAIGTGEAR
jgi:hypothetical protein